MTFLIIKILKKFLKLVLDNDNPKQISAGFTLGMLVGIAPFNIIYALCPLLMLCLFTINVSGFFFGILIFGLLAFLLNPIANQIGIMLLIEQPGLVEFWTILYNLPVISLLNINNTLMLGSMVLGLLLIVPVYFGFIKWVSFFQTKLRDKIMNSKFIKGLKVSPFFKWFFRVKELVT